jgi:hypothetical protein
MHQAHQIFSLALSAAWVRNTNSWIAKIHPKMPKSATFSHCWGESKPFCTTKSNNTARNFWIPFSLVTKWQNIPNCGESYTLFWLNYLWINSIFIPQDGKENREIEDSKIADIYIGSWVVVAECRAQDGEAGFLRSCEENWRLNILLEPMGDSYFMYGRILPVYILRVQ